MDSFAKCPSSKFQIITSLVQGKLLKMATLQQLLAAINVIDVPQIIAPLGDVATFRYCFDDSVFWMEDVY